MANEQDIEFRLKTLADTTGAEEVEKSLFKVEDAAKQFERELDVMEAKRRKANSEAAEAIGAAKADQAVNDREANLRGMAVGWVRVGESIRQYGSMAAEVADKLEGLDEKTKKLIKNAGEGAAAVGGVVSSVAQGFAAGGPMGAVIGAATSGLALLGQEYAKMSKVFDDTNAAIRLNAELSAKLANLKVKLPMAQAAEEALKKVKELVDYLEKLQQMESASRSADKKINDTLSPQTGAKKSLSDNNAEANNINAAADAALEKVQATTIALETAEEKVKRVSAAWGEDHERTLEAVKERDQALDLKTQAEDYSKKLEAEAPQAFALIAAKNSETLNQAKEEELQAATANANEIKGTFEEIIRSQGGKGSPTFTKALADITAMLENGKIDEAELKKFDAALSQARSTSESQKNQLSETLLKMNQVNAAIIADLKQRDGEINANLKAITDWQRVRGQQMDDLRTQVFGTR